MSPPVSHDLYDRVHAAAAVVRANAGGRTPSVGLILGSGLGGYAERLEDAVTIHYGDIPGFPVSRVHGHAGCLVIGRRGGAMCIAMNGRAHLYEGWSAAEAAFPTRVLIALGARVLLITNAAGGLQASWPPGTLMLIRDHIDFLRDHPLRGLNDERLGPRFPDMTHAYAGELRQLAHAVAAKLQISLQEGVYVAMPGPCYETPAEVRMLQGLGADATGMSTVPEVVTARHMGARVIGISCITNKAAGITGEALSHDEVTATATRVRSTFEGLLDGILAELVARNELTGAAT